MEVSDVRINLLHNQDGAVRAIGSFSLDGSFAVRGVRVMEDKHGRAFVSFPSRQKKNGEYEDVAFPLNKDFYHKLTDAILQEYDRLKEETESEDAAPEKEADKEAAAEEERAVSKRGRGGR